MKKDEPVGLILAQVMAEDDTEPTQEQIEYAEDFMRGKVCNVEATEEFIAAALAARTEN